MKKKKEAVSPFKNGLKILNRMTSGIDIISHIYQNRKWFESIFQVDFQSLGISFEITLRNGEKFSVLGPVGYAAPLKYFLMESEGELSFLVVDPGEIYHVVVKRRPEKSNIGFEIPPTLKSMIMRMDAQETQKKK